MSTGATRTVVLVVRPGVVLLDLAGPMQVLHGAGGYRILVASPDGCPVPADVGTPLGVDLALPDVRPPVDTLLVPGVRELDADPAAAGQVRRIGAGARRVASVCTGAFLLAEAGFLAGRRATTHWNSCAEFAARFPDVTVEPDAIHVRDGRVRTSAGMTAGIDLALALVEEDHGAARARTVARHLVVFPRRVGGQSQFSDPHFVPAARHPVLRGVLDAVTSQPDGDHRLGTLAARALVSERHLTRLFRRELGRTPGQYVEQVRIQAARALLESGDASVAAIARATGFGSAETLRRSFHRVLGTTPTAYRQRFHPTAGP
ncbi:transcriptional regulator, AraC family with amidase-like domain [Micromonospora citrea]|uniref:Transcriptional regulator, AraC family with amidase-like domain n=1 Tax=Micromonospora citrea TaxID=47855 RepID=A0A1C6UTP4_9ACTN|nr:helix-turn-helix domain-containing protein [Micromonospora citrea]SCL57406.1 transcriptional regulator, AraC family with amidase-like domain [Micromonospora citrea]